MSQISIDVLHKEPDLVAQAVDDSTRALLERRQAEGLPEPAVPAEQDATDGYLPSAAEFAAAVSFFLFIEGAFDEPLDAFEHVAANREWIAAAQTAGWSPIQTVDWMLDPGNA